MSKQQKRMKLEGQISGVDIYSHPSIPKNIVYGVDYNFGMKHTRKKKDKKYVVTNMGRIVKLDE